MVRLGKRPGQKNPSIPSNGLSSLVVRLGGTVDEALTRWFLMADWANLPESAPDTDIYKDGPAGQ